MKIVKAFIKERKLSDVVVALKQIEGFTGISIVKGAGFGRGHAKGSSGTVTMGIHHFIENFQLEIICSKDLVDKITKTIQEKAHTGIKGDGKIFVYEVSNIVRISSGERGEQAI